MMMNAIIAIGVPALKRSRDNANQLFLKNYLSGPDTTSIGAGGGVKINRRFEPGGVIIMT